MLPIVKLLPDFLYVFSMSSRKTPCILKIRTAADERYGSGIALRKKIVEIFCAALVYWYTYPRRRASATTFVSKGSLESGGVFL